MKLQRARDTAAACSLFFIPFPSPTPPRSVMSTGKVYLVGAGPGHPQLLTLKAHELICAADIIIYDRLIQEDVLAWVRPDAEQMYVGKASGLHQSRQEEINQTLVDAAHRAQLVVRLKGGDPVMFGRGGEEAEHLAANGIPFEVVPGVTAGLSVPMAAGIPVTHRDYSHGVALVTGHRRDDKDTEEPHWEALARMDTLVFFMSVGKLPEITQSLMAHGRHPDTPVAIIQMGYWPEEQVVVGQLRNIAQLSVEAEVKPPATIVVGEVVKMRDKLTTLHRDLRRDDHQQRGFGLSGENLMRRIGSGIRASRDVLASLELDLYADLEEAISPEDLAQRRNLSLDPLRDLLTNLANLGLLLRSQGTYRNAEAASKFLRKGSNEFMGEAVIEMVAKEEQYDPMVKLTCS